jgi:hypothetical protein
MTARTRQQMYEEAQCARCAGSGIAEHPLKYGPMSCPNCTGSGLVRPPKFRAECECGEKQPRWSTAFTAEKWMRQHLRSHAPEEPDPDLLDSDDTPREKQ